MVTKPICIVIWKGKTFFVIWVCKRSFFPNWSLTFPRLRESFCNMLLRDLLDKKRCAAMKRTQKALKKNIEGWYGKFFSFSKSVENDEWNYSE